MGESTLSLQKVYLNCAVLEPSQLLQNYVPFPDKAQKKKPGMLKRQAFKNPLLSAIPQDVKCIFYP